MIQVLSAADHVVAVRIAGRVTGEDIDQVTRTIDFALDRHQRLGIYVDALEFDDITADALAKDLRFAARKFGEWSRFARVAVVTEKEWLRTLARFEDRLIPGIDIRCFDAAGRQAALDWVAGVLGEEADDRPTAPAALHMLPTTRRDTFALVWNGRLRPRDVRVIVPPLEAALAAHDRVRMLVRFDRFDGFDPTVLAMPALMRLKVEAVRKLDRYAVVGGPDWLPRAIGMAAPLVGVDARHFDLAAEDEAWAWLEARPQPVAGEPRAAE